MESLCRRFFYLIEIWEQIIFNRKILRKSKTLSLNFWSYPFFNKETHKAFNLGPQHFYFHIFPNYFKILIGRVKTFLVDQCVCECFIGLKDWLNRSEMGWSKWSEQIDFWMKIWGVVKRNREGLGREREILFDDFLLWG